MHDRLARALTIALSVLLLLLLPAPAGADDISDARREREEARRERAAAAAELDTLEADNQELESAASELARQVTAQEAQVGDARRARAAAEAELEAARARVAAAEAEVAALEALVRDRAVAAYVNPAGTELTTILASGDLNEAARKEAFIRQVARADRGLLDRFRAARQDRQVQEERAQGAAERAERQQGEEEAALATLEETQAAQARVQQALEARIVEFRAEVDALADQEAELTEIIRRHEEIQRREREEAERRAREEREHRARQAGEARRQAEADARARAERERQSAAAPAPPPAPAPAPEPAPPPAADPPPSRSGGLVWPVRGPVTSEFGWRWGRMHNGIDIGAGTGTPIRAAGSGTVIFAGWMNGYGNVVLVDHANGMTTVYAHQSRLGSSEGQRVGQGEVIGYVGSTGRSTGPHLHFETRVGGSARNPRNYLP